MHLRLLIAVILLFGIQSANANIDKHIEVSMRMIGHQVLLYTGDSTSVVKPIQQEGNTYKISFNTQFSFEPDLLIPMIDSVIKAANISSHYVAEFHACLSEEVLHAYEMSDTGAINPCGGRAQPYGCYELHITLMDAPQAPISSLPSQEAEGENSMYLIVTLLIVIVIAAVFVVRFTRKTGDSNPNLVKMGEFVFNKRNHELRYNNNRVELTGKEAELLGLLLESVNDTVERDEILKIVWGDDGDYVGRTLDVFISKLRKKLEADSTVRIVNIRGIGYKLVLGE